MKGTRVSIAIVEDHLLAAEGLRLTFIEAGHAASIWAPADLPRLAGEDDAARPAEVVLLDLDLGGGVDGRTWIEPLVSAGRVVVVCTGETDNARLGACLAAGAAGVVGKQSSAGEVLVAVERASAGLPVMGCSERCRLLTAHQEHQRLEEQRLAPFVDLTTREAQILGLLLDGVSAAGIAVHHDVSVKTVRHQIASLLTKLDVRSQIEAVALAQRHGWRAPADLGGGSAP